MLGKHCRVSFQIRVLEPNTAIFNLNHKNHGYTSVTKQPKLLKYILRV